MEQKVNIGQDRTDLAVVIAKGVFGALPYIGSAVAEIVGTIIPNQRIDRIAEFLEILDVKVRSIEADVLKTKMQTQEFIDLFEDGMRQASRALTRERKEYIASLLKNSLSRDDSSYIHQKRILAILDELNDAEIIILQSYYFSVGDESRAFWEQHKDVLQPPFIVTGSSQEEINRAAVYKTYREHLRRLGLIQTQFKKPRSGELPEFDFQTGMIKTRYSRVTNLGRLLISCIDLDQDDSGASRVADPSATC